MNGNILYVQFSVFASFVQHYLCVIHSCLFSPKYIIYHNYINILTQFFWALELFLLLAAVNIHWHAFWWGLLSNSVRHIQEATTLVSQSMDIQLKQILYFVKAVIQTFTYPSLCEACNCLHALQHLVSSPFHFSHFNAHQIWI